MFILCLNSGSSTLKFKLFASYSLKALAWGTLDHGKTMHAKFSSYTADGDLREAKLEEKDLDGAKGTQDAAAFVIRGLTEGKTVWGLGDRVKSCDISVVCHRVVHGGEKYVEPTRLSKEILASLEKLSDLAPLHNPESVSTIKTAVELLPDADHIALFDTAFHASLPPHSFLYPLDYSHYENHRIRKFGFHGLSHKFISEAAAGVLDKPYEQCKFITLHLGGGCSACAISNGASVDTSMGLTPVEGLMMATRSGDVDPGAVLQLVRLYDGDAHKVEQELNTHSGIVGIAGTSDFRTLLAEAKKEGNVKASLALRMFVQRIAKIIGAYWVTLGGVDAVVFSGGIGENSSELRGLVARELDCLGAILCDKSNTQNARIISTAESRFALMVIPTNEELEMARQAQGLLAWPQKA